MKIGKFVLLIATLGLLCICTVSQALAQGRDHQRDSDYPARGNNDRNDRSRLRDTVRRFVEHARNFQGAVDNSMDRGKLDGTRREDRINFQAQNLRNAAVALRDKLGEARNLDNSANEARKALEIASRLDAFVGRGNVDLRTRAFWDQIRADLRVISNAYGFRAGEFLDNKGR